MSPGALFVISVNALSQMVVIVRKPICLADEMKGAAAECVHSISDGTVLGYGYVVILRQLNELGVNRSDA